MSSDKYLERDVPDDLRFLSDLQERPWAYDFFAVARRFEAKQEGPGFGRSALPSQDPVRFGQSARMEFSPRAIDKLEVGLSAPHLRLLFSGLFGANGPMPYHLTEFITNRRQHHDDTTIEAFANIFHHRFFSLLYRAWADSEPIVGLDRLQKGQSEDDPYARFMGAIGGTANLPGANFTDQGRRYYMGQIGSSSARPESLERILSDHTGVPIKLKEFKGRWLDVDQEDQSKLGQACLGDGSVLGSSVWSRNSAFEIEVGPLTPDDYRAFLPDGKQAALVDEIVTAVVGLEFEWELRLLCKGHDVNGVTLDGPNENVDMLGWTSWLGTPKPTAICKDLVIADQRYACSRI